MFLVVSPLHALSLSQVRTEIRLRVKDVSTSRQRYSDTQLNNMINEASRDSINATWAIVKSTSFALVSGTTYYSDPTDLIAILRLTHANINIPEATLAKLDSDYGNGSWLNTGGSAPIYYYQDMSRPGQIGFYPWPNTATSTGTVVMNYAAQPATLSADSDIPFNSITRLSQYHDLLIFYVAFRICLVEGRVDLATVYRQEYESRLTLMRDRCGTSPNYSPGFSGGPSK